MTAIKALLAELIRFQSVTPEDAGCQPCMANFLKELGFDCQQLDNPPVANLFARHGQGSPLLVFAGHTDVVPIGDAGKWLSNPFELTESNGLLYGRGTADMKGSLAAMMIAAQRFIHNHPDFSGSLGFLITSGEEGDLFDKGTPHVMAALKTQGIHIDYCVVGEPSSTHHVGDVVKIGRRGSLSANMVIHGKQGHVAYPHLAENPIHTVSPALAELTHRRWDEGNPHFPPTSMQITHLKAGGHAGNIIPGELELQLNFRFSTEQTPEKLQDEVEDCLKRHGLKADIDWRVNGLPFLTNQGNLLESAREVIQTITGKEPELSTSGGTSDGRFIAPYGVEVIELGPVNATIHQVNECVSERELETLSLIYYALCEKLLCPC
ncbi:succinyl-diaminopimelate desuccinylase [Legionella taurinensis]|uniref:Succinyl-diaminopimelate desuccinylase n=1 Tax=Legionella taurinensis TaxID=70611 RepID=A0AB38N9R8_9GAMM|nr:succinyl-diaminopimelate desuccinylase [Legionella taurinensis]MDX1836731.1 succinyl-diaminopimelate desuccinylase [Legionella taurinensis]PUT42816.1 succinyl-diaminopimelate desuccinylase [Legionella taurinensis]PUT45371.1 succinyl-diaminopimelate desuccinylase [Legionella taurinensis]PUT47054.1 succinyl-diaminopimelate desuccinylase [Legionella taurinensis]PUT49138.1 succinyl-diaminopimelate desuccinylase [Legionella taurinensis]